MHKSLSYREPISLKGEKLKVERQAFLLYLDTWKSDYVLDFIIIYLHEMVQ